MPKLSSKELFLACLSNPTVVRSRLEKGDGPAVGELTLHHVGDNETSPLQSKEVTSSRPLSANSRSLTATSNDSSFHSSMTSMEEIEVVHMCPSSPTKQKQQSGLPVHSSDSVTSRLSLSLTREQHRRNSESSLKPLPPRTLAQARWSSSRSIKDTPPEEKNPSKNPHVLLKDKTPRSPHKTRRGAASIQASSLHTDSRQRLSRPVKDSKPVQAQSEQVQVEFSQSLLEGLTLQVPFDKMNGNCSLSSVSSSDLSSMAASPKTREGLAEARWASSRCILRGLDDDEESIHLDVEPPRSPRRVMRKGSSTRSLSQEKTERIYTSPLKSLSKSVANFYAQMSLADAKIASPKASESAITPISPEKASFQTAAALKGLMKGGILSDRPASKSPARSSSAAALPPKTIPRNLLAETRWDSSRSLNAAPPLVPFDDGPVNVHKKVEESGPRSRRKSIKKGDSIRALMATAMAEEVATMNAEPPKSIPPQTFRPTLTVENRWDSSRSLNDSAPLLPVETDDSSPHVALKSADDEAPRPPRKSLKKGDSIRALLANLVNEDVDASKDAAARPPRKSVKRGDSDSARALLENMLAAEGSSPNDSTTSHAKKAEDTAPLSPRNSIKKGVSTRALLVNVLATENSPTTAASQKSLPPKTFAPSALTETRWESSRSLNSTTDKAKKVEDTAPRSPRKSIKKAYSSRLLLAQGLQSIDDAAAQKALPPKTVRMNLLADARWDSSRSLNDNAPQLPPEDESLADTIDSSPHVLLASPRKAQTDRLRNHKPSHRRQPSKDKSPTKVSKRVSLASVRIASVRSMKDTSAKSATDDKDVVPATSRSPRTLMSQKAKSLGQLPSKATGGEDTVPMAPRSPHKALAAKAKSMRQLPSKTPSPRTTSSANASSPSSDTLSEVRWSSSRSLVDAPPKTPKSPRKKHKDTHKDCRHLRTIFSSAKDITDIQSMPAPPAPPVPDAFSTAPVPQSHKSILSSQDRQSPGSIATPPSATGRKSDQNGTPSRLNRVFQRRRLSLLKSASAKSKQKNGEENQSLKDVLDEYAMIIDEFSSGEKKQASP